MGQPVSTVIERLVGNDRLRGVVVTLYYFAIIVGLILLYGRGDFSTPGFIYQGF